MIDLDLGPSSEPRLGDELGPYRLIRRIGEGATGRVFEVEHQRIGRRAAIKILSPEATVPWMIKRLVNEAQAVNLINHPNILEIIDVLEPQNGQGVHALVMELLEGTSLADLVAGEEPISAPRLLAIVAQICDGLAAVHAAGFVHRDLKTDNVFLINRDGNPDYVKLLDFGLVKAMRGDHEASSNGTIEGTFLGSPAYASPEQAAGKPVDHRTDVYSLGVMVFELATGTLPFTAEGVRDLLMKQITEPAPHLPEPLLATELGQALDAIIQTCLQKDPAERVFSASQLADRFRQLAIDGGATAAAMGDVSSATVRGPRLRRAWLGLAAPVAAAVIGLFLAVSHAGRKSPATAGDAPGVPPSNPTAARAVVPSAATPPEDRIAGAQGEATAIMPRSTRPARRARNLTEATTVDPFR
jgi:eukaryotic-like serine/threonine-protein kinase